MFNTDEPEQVPAWRRGLVTEVDPATCRVRLQLPDADGVLTDWLPVVVPFALGARAYWLPRVNSQVVALLDENLEDGVVVGSIYSKADPAPISVEKTLYLEMDDGTKVKLDPVAQLVRVETPGQVQVQATGNVSVNTSGDATVQAGGKATIQAASEVDITAPLTKVSGDLQVAGIITAPDATLGGKSFNAHKHGSVQAGLAQTSAPV